MSNIIVMAFSPRNIVGCFLKKGLQKGGHGHPRNPPRYALELSGTLFGKVTPQGRRSIFPMGGGGLTSDLKLGTEETLL